VSPLECAALLCDLDGVLVDSRACVERQRLGKLLVGGAEYPAEGGCGLRSQVAISAEMRLDDLRG
jgi:hypothetical protein